MNGQNNASTSTSTSTVEDDAFRAAFREAVDNRAGTFSKDEKAQMREQLRAAVSSGTHAEAAAGTAHAARCANSDVRTSRASANASHRPARYTAARPPRTRWAIAAGLAAALVFGGGGAALASGAISVSLPDAVADLFDGHVADTEIVEKVGRPVGASATSNGVTVTADAIAGDASNIKILYTISRDDGEPFDIPEDAKMTNGLLTLSFDAPGSIINDTHGMGGGSYFYDADPTDNRIQYVEEWSVDADGSLIGKTVHADFRDLKAYATDEIALAKGEWKLDFKINYEDASRALAAGTAIDQSGMSATIAQVSISPVGFSVEYLVDDTMDYSTFGSGSSGQMTASEADELDRFYNHDYVITMKDGSQISTSEAGGSANVVGDKTEVRQRFFFDSIIDVDQVESVTINGVEIPFA